jgi:hypothetical protein
MCVLLCLLRRCRPVAVSECMCLFTAFCNVLTSAAHCTYWCTHRTGLRTALTTLPLQRAWRRAVARMSELAILQAQRLQQGKLRFHKFVCAGVVVKLVTCTCLDHILHCDILRHRTPRFMQPHQ